MRSMALEGKTKKLYPVMTVVEPQDVVTWHNGESAPMPGKGVLTVRTVVPLFERLEMCGRKTVFQSRLSEGTYLAQCADTIKLEVVVRFRNEGRGSLRKRRPDLPVGTLQKPIVEFYLKSHGAVFNGVPLPGDDPLITEWVDEGVFVHDAGKPIVGRGTYVPFSVAGYTLADLRELLTDMALRDAQIVREALFAAELDMGDVKLEYGLVLDLDALDRDGVLKWNVVLVEAPSNDEWRVKDKDGNERSKQNIRDGKSPTDAIEDYEFVAAAIERAFA